MEAIDKEESDDDVLKDLVGDEEEIEEIIE